MLAKHLGPLGVTIACEPGDYLVKESGVLLAEVVTLEDKHDGVTFAGLDAGFNVAPESFIYGALVPIVLARAVDAAQPSRAYTVAGNINEGDDLWGEGSRFPSTPRATSSRCCSSARTGVRCTSTTVCVRRPPRSRSPSGSERGQAVRTRSRTRWPWPFGNDDCLGVSASVTSKMSISSSRVSTTTVVGSAIVEISA